MTGAEYYRQSGPPRQITVATVVVLGFGVLYFLLGLMALTSAGERVSEVVMGDKSSAVAVAVVAWAGAALYVVPAPFLRRGQPWARYVIIGVATLGIVGGLLSIPTGLLGLLLHAGLLLLMVHPTTKAWFRR